MAPIVRGVEAQARFKKTAVIEQAPSSADWQKFNFYTEGFQPGQSLVADDEIGGTRDNVVDPVQGTLALPAPVGALQVALDLNQIGYWISSMWGPPVTTGTAAPYTHVWESGVLAPGLVHIEYGFTADILKMCDSQAVSQLSINMADEDGTRKVDLAFVGRSVRNEDAATATSMLETPPRDKVRATIGLTKVNGANFGNILGGPITLTNGVFSERYMDDSEWPSAVEMAQGSLTATPEIRMRADAQPMLALFDGVTPFTLEFLYQLAVGRSLSIKSQNAIANPVTPAAGGLGPMSVSPTFQCSQKITAATAPMTTITLLNSVASY